LFGLYGYEDEIRIQMSIKYVESMNEIILESNLLQQIDNHFVVATNELFVSIDCYANSHFLDLFLIFPLSFKK
jgi:hypothetical protein